MGRLPSSVSRPGLIVVAVALAVSALSAGEFRAMGRSGEVRPGPGVTRVGRLSDTLPGLAGTPGDTPVYTLAAPAGTVPGGTALILGGTHGDEPAGSLAAVVLVETARVSTGS
jgi:predicted deacylase